VAGVGIDVGPDIADTRVKTPEALLTDILNPNAAIDSNYINYTVTTKNGRSLTGIIAAETASSVTLRRAENQADVVLRQDIDEIVSSGVSLMPEGLEKTVSVEEMADLLNFLKNWRYLDGAVPVGKPQGR
jgi:putative heme-binding domain-containing protein